RRLGLARGDTLTIRVTGAARPVTLIGWLEPRDALSAQALERLLVTDIATAQELARARGRLTRIDLIVADDAAGRALLQRIRDALPSGAAIVSAGARAETVASMTAAFTLNLTALSLLALVVGMFLIYNTMTFSVLQRRPLIGMLRALGVTRGEVFALVVVEALVVGVVGTAAGLGLGLGLAHGLLGLVTRTINDLYFVLSVREVSLTGPALARSVLLGVGATLAAALAPAAEAAGARRPGLRPPRAAGGARHRGGAVADGRGHRGADDRGLGHHRRRHHDRELPGGGGGLAPRVAAGRHLYLAPQPGRESAGRHARCGARESSLRHAGGGRRQ